MAERRVGDRDDSEEFRALKKAIGKHLRGLRIERGPLGRKVAELAQISTGTYGVIECGRANVTLMSLHRIARALAVPLVSLLEDTPAQTTTGVKGVLAAVRDLGQAHRQLDLCQEEVRAGEFTPAGIRRWEPESAETGGERRKGGPENR